MTSRLLVATIVTAGLNAALACMAPAAHAQAAAASAPAPWKYQTRHLDRRAVDALLAHPERLVVIDVRRPDEHIKYGAFPAFLSIQNSDLEKQLAYIPRDRLVLTVSNHAQRAGAAGDLLTRNGFQVAGAAGAEDYSNEGGTAVAKILPPVPAASAAAR